MSSRRRRRRTSSCVAVPEPAATPEAQLRALLAKFEATEQKRIRAARTALRTRLPTAHELLYDYGTFFVIAYSPTEHPTDGIVSLAARPDGLRLYVMHGPQLPDPKKLLGGTGKQARFLRLESARQLAHPDVEALIAAAVAHADVPLPAEGRGTLIVRTFGGKRQARRTPAR